MGKLTTKEVSTKSAPGRYGDGNGLYMVVSPAGTKNWVQRVRIDGKRTDRGLGGVGQVSLAEARKAAITNLAALKHGRNPWDNPEPETAEPAVNAIPTFPTAVKAVYEANRENWGDTTAKRWLARMERHASEPLADRDVAGITRRELAAVLSPLRKEHHETARKVRQGMAKVFRWVRANDYRADDPADDALDELVAQVKSTVKHRESLHFSEVSGAINKLRFGYALRTTALAFEFLILTAARTSEVRFMTWEEVDLENALWEIPADRMKAKRSHKVPLSNQAVNILYGLKHLPDPDAEPGSLFATYEATSGYVFLMPNGKTLSENAFLNRCRKDKLGCVPHGFRSSFRDYAKAVYGASWEAAELSLAHSIGTTVSQAYFRTDLIDERRPLMQAWADYLDPLPF